MNRAVCPSHRDETIRSNTGPTHKSVIFFLMKSLSITLHTIVAQHLLVSDEVGTSSCEKDYTSNYKKPL